LIWLGGGGEGWRFVWWRGRGGRGERGGGLGFGVIVVVGGKAEDFVDLENEVPAFVFSEFALGVSRLARARAFMRRTKAEESPPRRRSRADF